MNDDAWDKLMQDIGEIKGSLKTIEKNDTDNTTTHRDIYGKIDEHGVAIAELKVRTGIIGALSGAITGGMAALVGWLSK